MVLKNSERLENCEQFVIYYNNCMYDWFYQLDKQNLRRNLIVANPLQQTIGVRTIDRDRFKKLQKRFKHDLKEYYQRKEQLGKAYENACKIFTSETFWKKYLAI